jgi:hypothetical protein
MPTKVRKKNNVMTLTENVRDEWEGMSESDRDITQLQYLREMNRTMRSMNQAIQIIGAIVILLAILGACNAILTFM